MGFLSNLIGSKEKFQRAGGKTNKATSNQSKFRGVQLNPNNDDCCEAVRESICKRFLSNQVPMLPLTGCDSGDCRCTYQLYDDRRTDIRRAGDVVHDLLGQLRLANRRSAQLPGRRCSD